MWSALVRAARRALPSGVVDALRFEAEAVLEFPMEATDVNALSALRSHKRCFHCGGADHWYEGAQGGMSVNIMCGSCGQKLNWTPFIPQAEPIGCEPGLRRMFNLEGQTVDGSRVTRWIDAGRPMPPEPRPPEPEPSPKPLPHDPARVRRVLDL